jgi:hypothetical protein
MSANKQGSSTGMCCGGHVLWRRSWRRHAHICATENQMHIGSHCGLFKELYGKRAARNSPTTRNVHIYISIVGLVESPCTRIIQIPCSRVPIGSVSGHKASLRLHKWWQTSTHLSAVAAFAVHFIVHEVLVGTPMCRTHITRASFRHCVSSIDLAMMDVWNLREQ